MQSDLCWYRRWIFLTAFFTYCFSVLPLYLTWIVIYNKVCLCLHNDIRALIHTCLRVCVCVCVWGGGGGRVSCVWVWAIVYVCTCHLRDRKKIFLPLRTKIKS